MPAPEPRLQRLLSRLAAGGFAALACLLLVPHAAASDTKGAVQQPAPLGGGAVIAQTWAFDDPAGTTLPAVANGAIGGSAWTASIAGVATTGTGALRLGYSSTAVANSFAPLNISDGGVYYLSATFAAWDILNGAASGTTRPIFNLGLRSAASTSAWRPALPACA